jgi:hypothetical protein
MQESMQIADLERDAAGHQVQFELRGPRRADPIWFHCSESPLDPSAEALLALALLPAMRAGVDLDLSGPASARLMSALPSISAILTAWIPKLEPVAVRGLVPTAKQRAGSGRVGVFFSGGLDSFYSFLKHRDEITDLIFVRGFDVAYTRTELLSDISNSLEEVAKNFGVGVVQVETNLRDVILRFVPWWLPGHGPALIAVGHLLAPAFERIYIPSTFTYANLFPWATHPLLDPLWSSEVLEFIHDGCEADRVAKAELVGSFEVALRNLRVCSRSHEGARNCGSCEKCIRTMINLEAVGKLGECTVFDASLDAASVRKLPVTSLTRPFFEENLAALRRRGVRPDLQRALERDLRRPVWPGRVRQRLRKMRRRAGRVFRRKVLRQRVT